LIIIENLITILVILINIVFFLLNYFFLSRIQNERKIKAKKTFSVTTSHSLFLDATVLICFVVSILLNLAFYSFSERTYLKISASKTLLGFLRYWWINLLAMLKGILSTPSKSISSSLFLPSIKLLLKVSWELCQLRLQCFISLCHQISARTTWSNLLWLSASVCFPQRGRINYFKKSIRKESQRK